MPMLKNPRHELVAQAVALGRPYVRAYAAAGYRAQRSNASRLIAKDSTRRRIDELRTEHAKMSKRTREEHLEKMYEREAKADEKGQFAAAQQVSRDISAMNNWVTERREIAMKQDSSVDLSKLSLEARTRLEVLAAEIRAIMANGHDGG